MKTYAIVEIEEGSLTLTIGAKAGDAARIFSCERFSLPETSQDAVANVLRGLGADPLRGATGVHVIVGDRRAAHFVSTVPKMPAAEVVDFVTREALRVSSLSSPKELLIAPRLLRQLPGGRLAVGVAAFPTAVWNPIESVLEAGGLEICGLHTTESCLALAGSAQKKNVAVLELSGSRARFVLCDEDAPVQVRRFILGGASGGGSMAIAAQLAIELPRTFDWLRESGHAAPATMLLGNRLGLDQDSIEMMRGDLEEIGSVRFDWELPDDLAASPGLATLMLMGRLFKDRPVPSLLGEAVIRVPWSKARIGAVAAAATVGIAMSVSAITDAKGYMDAAAEYEKVSAECRQLEQQALAAEAAAMPGGEIAVADPQLDLALSMRRPVSRMLADVSNAANERVHIASMQFSSTERMTIFGIVKGRSRQEALAVLTQFVNQLRGLPYFQRDGQDEVTEVPGDPNCLRFQLGIEWRSS